MVLVLCVHGDREGEAERVLAQLVAALQVRMPHLQVEGAMLLSTPPALFLENVLLRILQSGAESVQVMPWFLFAGPHVRRDIPAIIASVLTQFPNRSVTLLEPLGADPVLVDLLVSRVGEVGH